MTRMTQPALDVYVEVGVGMAHDRGCAVWSFDPDLWGTCTQGLTADDALATFTVRHGPTQVVETIHGDERAFARDRELASDDELSLALAVLARQRRRAIRLLAAVPPELLDVDDPARVMPDWATWRTLRGMFWHICDTESRYYLPRCGLPSRGRSSTLERELAESARHVRSVLAAMPRDLDRHTGGEKWTSTKLVRRLAWHERGELDVVEALLSRAEQA